MQITTDVSEIPKTVQRDLNFTLNTENLPYTMNLNVNHKPEFFNNAPSHISSDFLRTATLWKKLFPQSSIQLFTRSSHPEMFLKKGFLIICSKFTGEDPCPSVILIKMQSKFIEITLRHGCYRVFL